MNFILNEKKLIQYKINKKILKLYEVARNFETLLLLLYNYENVNKEYNDEDYNDLIKLFNTFKTFKKVQNI